MRDLLFSIIISWASITFWGWFYWIPSRIRCDSPVSYLPSSDFNAFFNFDYIFIFRYSCLLPNSAESLNMHVKSSSSLCEDYSSELMTYFCCNWRRIMSFLSNSTDFVSRNSSSAFKIFEMSISFFNLLIALFIILSIEESWNLNLGQQQSRQLSLESALRRK